MTALESMPNNESIDSPAIDFSQYEENLTSTSDVEIPTESPEQPSVNTQQTCPGVLRSMYNAKKPLCTALTKSTMQLAAGYPLSYIRALMQIGYEPLPAIQGKSLFGKESLYYPNGFVYLKHIYRIDGFIGLYRGLGCSLAAEAISVYTIRKFDEYLGSDEIQESAEQTDPSWKKCIQKTLHDVHARSWGVLISHPFHVMAIRCMGQFIGREQVYSSINIFQNCRTIYESQSIGGFFIGLIPRWLLEISVVIITNVVIHWLKTTILSKPNMRFLNEYVANFIAQTVTYPLNVVTTVAAINQSGLRAGMLPIMPVYAGWQDIFTSLKKTNQLKRGSGLINRAVLD